MTDTPQPAHSPALRLLLPMALGIAVADNTSAPAAIGLAVTAAGIVIYTALMLWARKPSLRLAVRPWWIVPIALMAIGTGMLTTAVHQPSTLDLTAINAHPALARIDDVQRKDFSMLLTATLLHPHHARVLISTRGCDYTLTEGDHIRFIAHFSPITNMGNPDEPDYATTMRHKGIIYQQHLDEAPSHTSPPNSSFSPMRLRHWLEDAVLSTHIGQSTQQLLIAMLLGDSRLIDPDTRQTFARAGVAHVLALSGLHVGIIAWMVWLLLFPLDYWRLKKFRLAITMLVLAAFCLLTGLSPSVMRATLMIGMAMCSYILFRRYAPLNSLAVAALLILIFAPQQLFSAGFQLSFITVLALLVTTIHMQKPRRHPVLNYIAGTLVTTAVATVATFMLTAHYFHTATLISLPTNLLVLPLIPVIIVLGTLVLVLAAMGIEWLPLNWLTDHVCSLLEGVSRTMSATPLAYLDNLYVGGATLTLYMLTLALVTWWLLSRKRAIGIAATAALLATVGAHVATAWTTPRSGLVIFNDFKSTPILGFHQGHAVLWIPDYDDEPAQLLAQFQQRHKAFLAHHGIDSIGIVTHTDTIARHAMVKPPFATMGCTHIMAIDDKGTAAMLRHPLPPLDIAVLGRHIQDKHLTGTHLPASLVVISGASRTPPHAAATGTHIHNLATCGAFVHFTDD
ncbi:MAG: ComEC/Rec2 family competence protein [Muribaculaceae bacterium]|nr:ComEC/Rec2 family competence protein [Muribaculaceae bacterium]